MSENFVFQSIPTRNHPLKFNTDLYHCTGPLAKAMHPNTNHGYVDTHIQNSLIPDCNDENKNTNHGYVDTHIQNSLIPDCNDENKDRNESQSHNDVCDNRRWDRFQLKEDNEEKTDVHNSSSFKLIRLIMYVFLFVAFLASMVAQKLSLAVASSKMPRENHEDGKRPTNSSELFNTPEAEAHGMLLLTAMCIPYIFNFLSSCWKVHFGNEKPPSILTVVLCVVLAVCQSVGLCLLVFHLLPNVGPIQGLLVLSATGVVPSLLKSTTTLRKSYSLLQKVAIFSLDILALLLQLSIAVLIFVPEVQFFCRISPLYGSKDLTPTGDIITDCINGLGSRFLTLFAIFLTSLAWLENFLEILEEKKDHENSKGFISRIQSDLKKNRAFINIFVSLSKILTSFLITSLVAKLHIFEPENWEELTKQSHQDVLDIILLVISSIVCYFLACLTCKLQMQVFSFAIPCLLSTPAATALLTFICQNNEDFLFDNFNFDCGSNCDANYLRSNYYLVLASLWLLSFYWTAGHIWFPKQEKLAQIERLFVNPLYCGILLEQDLVLNRKRDQDKTQEQDDIRTSENVPPMIYACATMWHETRFEMEQLLKSLFRMNKDQSNCKKEYAFEAHIFFDDAFRDGILNEYVSTFKTAIDRVIGSMQLNVDKPDSYTPCYGGQIKYKMPGGNFMYIHLKDKSKIRHKKRWSQVMYMYYLLGHRKAENAFILALDGDVDFTPGAVRILIDRMKKDENVGAACGRIHPIGNGPIVWYQKFEYAIAHWLQKATEHVQGCVLCSPGCFSLFRGSALMDDNVMKKYLEIPTDASEVLMYDLGEDRWLCTLLLQQGYRVDYAAGADAYTYAPEGFDEFFNQRKRWGPSTLANIMALLQNGNKVVKKNTNISWLYIVYLGSLMVSTIIGPATILMLIAGAFVTVFDLSIVNAYIASVIPGVLFFVICLVCSTKVQLIVAQVLSGFYVIIMMVVMVGLLITALLQSPYHPSVIFLLGLVIIFVVAATLHPREWVNILYGFLYFVSIPSGFLVQVIYSLCNLNDVSWGTRESSTPNKDTNKEKTALLNICWPFSNLVNTSPKRGSHEMEILKLIRDITSKPGHKSQSEEVVPKSVLSSESDKQCKDKKAIPEKDDISERKAETSKRWIEQDPFRGKRLEMNEKERKFWEDLVKKYLDPHDKEMKKDLTEELKKLRNNVCSGMALVNILWITVNFMFQFRSPTVVTFQLPIRANEDEHGINEMKIEMLGLLFIIFFMVLLLIQFCGMIAHRLGTFIHLVARAELPNPFKRDSNDKTKNKQDDIQNQQPDNGTQMEENSSHQPERTSNLKQRRKRRH